MLTKDFTRIFNSHPFLEEQLVASLERDFMDEDGFKWDASLRNVRKTEEFTGDIVDYDLQLASGEVRSILTSLGTRMIVVGTIIGNVILHERQMYYPPNTDRSDDYSRSLIIGHLPAVLTAIVGNKPLKDHQIYAFTGFFNSKGNLGHSLIQLSNALRSKEEGTIL